MKIEGRHFRQHTIVAQSLNNRMHLANLRWASFGAGLSLVNTDRIILSCLLIQSVKNK